MECEQTVDTVLKMFVLATTVDLSEFISFLSALSSIAVTLGVIFVVIQLRQNARLIEATVFQSKSNIAFSVLERLTDDSFAARRKRMHDVIKKYSQNSWEGFDDSLEDFEARNFGYLYELMGQLVKDGIIDKQTILNALQYLVVIDWEAFAPLLEHLSQRYGERFKEAITNPWENFQWLAEESRKYLTEKARSQRASNPKERRN